MARRVSSISLDDEDMDRLKKLGGSRWIAQQIEQEKLMNPNKFRNDLERDMAKQRRVNQAKLAQLEARKDSWKWKDLQRAKKLRKLIDDVTEDGKDLNQGGYY